MRNLLVVMGLLSLAAPAGARESLDITKYGIVYRVPGMDKVKVRKDLPFGDGLKLNLYLPANHSVARPVPVVVFINGVGDFDPANKLKDWQIYQDWPRLVAARGYAGIVADAPQGQVPQSVAALFEHVRTEGKKLGLDPDQVVAWSCSGNVTVALPFLMDDKPPGVKAAVIYYGTGQARAIRTDLPVYHVLAGKDGKGLIEGERQLWKRAVDARAPWTMVEEPMLPHAFDAIDTSEESRRVVAMTLAFIDANLRPLPPPPPPSQARDIVAAVYGQEHDKAIAGLEKIVAADPKDGDAWFKLAMTRKNAGQLAEAEKAYNKVMELDPKDPAPVRWLGVMKAQAGDCAGAAPIIDRAVAMGAKDPMMMNAMAGCHLQAGKPDLAAKLYEQAIAAGAQQPNMYYNLACAQAKAGKPDAAFAALDDAVGHGFNDRHGAESDADLNSLHADPRWKKLLDRLR